jgi:hypothetical protein
MLQLQFSNQIQLIKHLSRATFSEGVFDCVFVICKSPQLLALLSCYFSKKTVEKPFESGTCFYSPISEEKYRKIKIVDREVKVGTVGYWFEERDGKRDICKSWKPEAWFDDKAILAFEQENDAWIDGNNVNYTNLRKHPTVIFPSIMSSRSGFEACLSTTVFDETKLSDLLNIEKFDDNRDLFQFHSNNRVEIEDKNLIWINAIPHNLSGKKQLVFLSHNYNRFEELKVDIDLLYLEYEQLKVWKQNTLPSEISELVRSTNVNTPISVWSL